MSIMRSIKVLLHVILQTNLPNLMRMNASKKVQLKWGQIHNRLCSMLFYRLRLK